MEANDIFTSIAIGIGIAFAAGVNWWRANPLGPKAPPLPHPLLSIGAELGTRADIEMLTKAVHRIADIMEDKHDKELAASMKEVLARMDKMQHPPEIRTHQPNEPPKRF